MNGCPQGMKLPPRLAQPLWENDWMAPSGPPTGQKVRETEREAIEQRWGAVSLPLHVAGRILTVSMPASPMEHHSHQWLEWKDRQKGCQTRYKMSLTCLCSQNIASYYSLCPNLLFPLSLLWVSSGNISIGRLSPSAKLNPTTLLLSRSIIHPVPLCNFLCEWMIR